MAGRIPQSFINDLIERADIVDVIDQRVQLKKAGKNYQALCPFHDEKTASFTVSADKGFYYCFGCGASGTALGFLMEFDRLDFVEAIETLAASLGLEVPREAGDARRAEDPGLYDVLERADRFFRQTLRGPSARGAVDYLKGRGVTGVTARDFGIGYAPRGNALKEALGKSHERAAIQAGLIVENQEEGRAYDFFRDRIMFPIRDRRGRVIAFGGRLMGDGHAKYLNSPESTVFEKSRELYGLFEVRRAVRQISQLLVVEGYMDVVGLAQHGILNAVATLGTASSNVHFDKLFRQAHEVVCCFDGDRAGRQAAWRALDNALPTLSEGRQLRFVFLPEGEDPDSLVRAEGKDSFQRRVDDAVPIGEYFFNHVSEGLDLASLDSRARLCELATPYLAKLPAGVYQRMMIERLSEMAQVSIAAIETQLRDAPSVSAPRAAPDESRSRPPPQRDSAMSRRLLGHLVRDPGLLQRLDGAHRARLISAADDDSMFVRVARFLSEDPAADVGTLIARFVGDAGHGDLIQLAKLPQPLGGDAVAVEFVDGVERYLASRVRQQRLSMIRELQQDGSTDQLARYWRAVKGSGTDATVS